MTITPEHDQPQQQPASSEQAQQPQQQQSSQTQLTQTQPTVVLTPPPTYAPHPSHVQASSPMPQQPAQPAPQQPKQKSRSGAGMFVAGIAIGAIVGGVVGGGSAAIVASNQQPITVAQAEQGGQLTLNNVDSATTVSGVAAVATPSVVTLEVTGRSAAGSGSGVIYSADGYIVTNAHVVTLDGEAGSNPEIRVWLSDGRILDGSVVGVDPFADLAVVKVEATGLTPIALGDLNAVNVGDLSVAIGAPLNLSNTVTSGVVSALNRGISVGSPILPDEQDSQLDEPDDSGDFPWFRFGDPNEQQQTQPQQQQATATRVTLPVVQTDASINPGNSGGALLNANAELIGINVAIASNGRDSSTAGSDGLGFAIPVNMVTRVADALIAGQRPSHGLLGIGVNDSTADTDADRNVAGGLVSEVNRGGPADLAGLKVGDVITAVDGIAADSGTTVSALIRMHEGGEEVTISYSRGGVKGTTQVTLGSLEW